jgi:hypothetical protein
MPNAPSPVYPACLNCDQPLPEPRPKFCPACGQETNVKPPTLREFAQQFGGAYFSTEGALWRTLKLLLTKPGELTKQYLAGRRKHYVLPLRLYLTISVIVLLVMRSLAALEVKVSDEEMSPLKPRSMSVRVGSGQAGLKDGVFFCDDLPAWLCKRLQRRIDIEPKALKREIENLSDRFMSSLGTAMFVLLPSFALWLRLLYRNRGLRYTEHLVFALHVHAFWFLMLGLMLTNQALLIALAMVAVPVYGLLAMRRVYAGRWWPRLLRAAVVSTLYSLTMAFAVAGVGLWAVLF